MRSSIIVLCFLLVSNISSAQSLNDKLTKKSEEIKLLEKQRKKIEAEMEDIKLEMIRYDLQQVGLPEVAKDDQLLLHSAMAIGFSPAYKQARWVAHIITPDIITGTVTRSNDFRKDSLVTSVSIEESDYFISTRAADGTVTYDGFGYDRGHLAPSADFRWSAKALSESYIYSNISPQHADFNRKIWGDLEDILRGYIYRNTSSRLYIITGPVLEHNLPVITKGKNKLPIPQKFWKVALDLKEKRAIGFILPNENITTSLKSFAVSVDSVEKLTGLNFYSKLPENDQQKLESVFEADKWLPETITASVEPLEQHKMAPRHFNTLIAKQWMNKNEEINVCGTVVDARTSRAGNILINLDTPFPNQVFTIFIKKEDIVNFSYDPVTSLKGKIVCAKGKVINLGGTATMYINNETSLKVQ